MGELIQNIIAPDPVTGELKAFPVASPLSAAPDVNAAAQTVSAGTIPAGATPAGTIPAGTIPVSPAPIKVAEITSPRLSHNAALKRSWLQSEARGVAGTYETTIRIDGETFYCDLLTKADYDAYVAAEKKLGAQLQEIGVDGEDAGERSDAALAELDAFRAGLLQRYLRGWSLPFVFNDANVRDMHIAARADLCKQLIQKSKAGQSESDFLPAR